MKGFLFRDWLASSLLAAGIVLGGMAFSEPAWPGEAPSDNPPIFVEPPTPLREGDEGTVTLPLVGICAMPLRLFTDADDHRLLTGHLAQRYIDAAEVDVLVGTDTVLYAPRDESVVVLFAKQGCVVGMYVVPRAVHRAVMERALGASLYVPTGGEAQKGDLLATAPLPQANPVPAPACNTAPFSVFAETPGWRALTGDKAVKYMDIAFNNHPPVDAVAFARAGDKVVVVIGLNGCAIGRQAIPAKGHQKAMELAFGIVA